MTSAQWKRLVLSIRGEQPPFAPIVFHKSCLSLAVMVKWGALARGRLEFRQAPVVDQHSQQMGVHERVFRLHPRQDGTFHPPQRLADAWVA